MRIIAGKMRGSSLLITSGKNTRPLKDMAREAIFNLLKHSNKISFEIEKSNILDLYAGTGSFGLECLSRNAQNVSFVEKEIEAIKILKKNIKKLKVENKSNIYSIDVFNFVSKNIKNKYDLIFCDPPFKNNDIKSLLEYILANKFLKKNGTLVLHRNKNTKDAIPKNFSIIEERVYGISKIIFGKFLT